jgi:hypothetical protein
MEGRMKLRKRSRFILIIILFVLFISPWSRNVLGATAIITDDGFRFEFEDSAESGQEQAQRGPKIQVTPTDPPPSIILPDRPPEGLTGCSEMTWYRIDARLPPIFDRIGWRESNCRNEESVHTFCCWGYWQMYVSLHLRDSQLGPRYAACGVSSRYDLDSDTHEDKLRQACVVKALYDVKGMSPWSATI